MKKENEFAEKGVSSNEQKVYHNPVMQEEEELELDSLFEVQGGAENPTDQDCGLGCYTGGLL